MNKKLVAWLLIALCLFAFSTYALTSGVLADHECTGEHCAVCLCMTLREQFQQLLLAAVLLGGLLTVCCALRVEKCVWLSLRALWTPVCLKVK